MLDGIQYCYEEGIPCIASTYVTKNSIKNFGTGKTDDSALTQIINLSKKSKASGIRILFPILSGRWEKDKRKSLLKKKKNGYRKN